MVDVEFKDYESYGNKKKLKCEYKRKIIKEKTHKTCNR